MTDEDTYGWWDVPGGETWMCPRCEQKSPVAEWKEVEAYCELCGSHDGRVCPLCHEVYDHVWDARELAEVNGGGVGD
jgi:Zn finger protein HypA/HybF involved in hydrogenase expression